MSTFAARSGWFPGAQTHLCPLHNTISSSCFIGVLHKLHRFCQLWGGGGWKAIPTVHPEYWDRQDQLQHLLHSWGLSPQSQAEDCSENGPCWHLHQHEQAHNFLWGHTARRRTNILDELGIFMESPRTAQCCFSKEYEGVLSYSHKENWSRAIYFFMWIQEKQGHLWFA